MQVLEFWTMAIGTRTCCIPAASSLERCHWSVQIRGARDTRPLQKQTVLYITAAFGLARQAEPCLYIAVYLVIDGRAWG